MVTKCSAGFYHLGDYWGKVNKQNFAVECLGQIHTCGKEKPIKDGSWSVFFSSYVEAEDTAAKIIWQALRGNPQGDTGCIVSNFIKWYQTQPQATHLDFQNRGLSHIPKKIEQIFQEIETLDLSGNRGFSVLPDIQVDELNLNDTAIEIVPFHLARKVTMLGIWVKFVETKGKLQELIIDDQILEGVFPYLGASSLTYLKIGPYEGTPQGVEKQILTRRVQAEQSLESQDFFIDESQKINCRKLDDYSASRLPFASSSNSSLRREEFSW